MVEAIFGVAVLIVVTVILLKTFGGSTPKDYLDTRGRPRCGRCKKISYRDSVSAQRAADNAGRRGTYLRAYHERKCGRWHLTSQPPRVLRF